MFVRVPGHSGLVLIVRMAWTRGGVGVSQPQNHPLGQQGGRCIYNFQLQVLQRGLNLVLAGVLWFALTRATNRA